MEIAIAVVVFFLVRELWRVHMGRKAAEEALENLPLIPHEPNRRRETIMNMRTLAVGQKVSMTKSSTYGAWGEVVELSPLGITVKTEEGLTLRFDNDGKQTDDNRRDSLGFGPSPGDRFVNSLWFSAPEFQPWKIDETYFPRPKASKGGAT